MEMHIKNTWLSVDQDGHEHLLMNAGWFICLIKEYRIYQKFHL